MPRQVDHRCTAPRRPGRVFERGDRALTSGTNCGHECCHDRYRERHCDHQGDGGASERRCARGTEEASSRFVDQWRHLPTDEQPHSGGAQADEYVLEEEHEGNNRGVPPTAFNRPTRRVWSVMRPPTSTATLVSARRASSQLPVKRTFCTLAITCASPSRMLCHEYSVGAVDEALLSWRLTNARALAGLLSLRFKR